MSGRIKRKVDDYIAPEFGQALSCSMYRAYLFTLSGRPYLIVRTLYSAADHTLHHPDVFCRLLLLMNWIRQQRNQKKMH